MVMVRIEPGEFLMGSSEVQIDTVMKQFPDLKRDWINNEQPQHPVRITRPFFLAAHPVTVGQFRQFVDDKVGHYNASNDWRNPGFQQGDDHPVVNVNYEDAVAFLGWLNDQEKVQGSRAYAS